MDGAEHDSLPATRIELVSEKGRREHKTAVWMLSVCCLLILLPLPWVEAPLQAAMFVVPLAVASIWLLWRDLVRSFEWTRAYFEIDDHSLRLVVPNRETRQISWRDVAGWREVGLDSEHHEVAHVRDLASGSIGHEFPGALAGVEVWTHDGRTMRIPTSWKYTAVSGLEIMGAIVPRVPAGACQQLLEFSAKRRTPDRRRGLMLFVLGASVGIALIEAHLIYMQLTWSSPEIPRWVSIVAEAGLIGFPSLLIVIGSLWIAAKGYADVVWPADVTVERPWDDAARSARLAYRLSEPVQGRSWVEGDRLAYWPGDVAARSIRLEFMLARYCEAAAWLIGLLIVGVQFQPWTVRGSTVAIIVALIVAARWGARRAMRMAGALNDVIEVRADGLIARRGSRTFFWKRDAGGTLGRLKRWWSGYPVRPSLLYRVSGPSLRVPEARVQIAEDHVPVSDSLIAE